MAQFTRANGDFYPVLRLDATGYSNPGVNAVESGMTVQPQGPKLDFFNIQMTDIAANTTLANISMLTIQTKAIVYIYEFTDDASDDLAIAVYPTGAWTTTTLATEIDAATGGTSTVTASATFTN
jgi:hypothetical protein|tara:strand:+ start:79 stop:450 length:372 start_codon:yes stop_codon:yes gene_type:complete